MMKSDRNSKKKSGKSREFRRKNDEKLLRKEKYHMKVEATTSTQMLSKQKRNQKVIIRQEAPLDSSEVNKHKKTTISLENKRLVDLKKNTKSLITNLKYNMKIIPVFQEMVSKREQSHKFRNLRKKKNDQ